MDEYRKERAPEGYYLATPRPTEEELDKFYSDAYFKEGVTTTYQIEYSDLEMKQKYLRAEASVEFIKHNLSGQNPVVMLEIGCGEGFILDAADKAGWQVNGVDFQLGPIEKFNPNMSKYFTRAHPSVYLQEKIRGDNKFDVIILQNVLEHVLHPKELLMDVRGILSEKGCVFIQVPNDYSRIQQIALDEKRIDREFWFCPPQHLNYFNAESFETFIEKAEFEFVDVFSDFPIELYLWGGENNYVTDPSLGKRAHNARVQLDLAIAENGMEAYIQFYRSAYKVGVGRNLIGLVKPKA